MPAFVWLVCCSLPFRLLQILFLLRIGGVFCIEAVCLVWILDWHLYEWMSHGSGNMKMGMQVDVAGSGGVDCATWQMAADIFSCCYTWQKEFMLLYGGRYCFCRRERGSNGKPSVWCMNHHLSHSVRLQVSYLMLFGWKTSYMMLFLCQDFHIWRFRGQNFHIWRVDECYWSNMICNAWLHSVRRVSQNSD